MLDDWISGLLVNGIQDSKNPVLLSLKILIILLVILFNAKAYENRFEANDEC